MVLPYTTQKSSNLKRKRSNEDNGDFYSGQASTSMFSSSSPISEIERTQGQGSVII